ncbi:ribonuclease Z [Oceanobacillus manasiensis]|uniref:ribonuclease Z n=1 Tax=Oceanobacillus manasiensis TaxID=586413 RepID=UPI0005A9E91C|nr:ribonuclease Z [Oceanobacillus manasiensis]
MELVFLGTGAGVPSKERNVSSVALTLLQEQNSVWLFDCGEATQHQILNTSIKPRKINKIFITHLHGDHIFGLPGLLSSRSFQGGEDEVILYGPEGLKDYIDISLKVSGTHLRYPIIINEITEGKVVEDDQFTVYAKKLDHGITSYGYRIVEKDKPGELLVEQLKQIGIPPGPLYRKIKENEYVETDDGLQINRRDFIGPNKPGRVLAILGDTRALSSHHDFIKDANVLVHETTFDRDKAQMAWDYFHSTTTQAANAALEANVKKLVMTHISSRYQKEENDRLLQEAKQIFQNTVLATDFYKMDIGVNS